MTRQRQFLFQEIAEASLNGKGYDAKGGKSRCIKRNTGHLIPWARISHQSANVRFIALRKVPVGQLGRGGSFSGAASFGDHHVLTSLALHLTSAHVFRMVDPMLVRSVAHRNPWLWLLWLYEPHPSLMQVPGASSPQPPYLNPDAHHSPTPFSIATASIRPESDRPSFLRHLDLDATPPIMKPVISSGHAWSW